MIDKVKVFISWSGERSRRTALVLREWLPQVLQLVETWMSEEDIDKGSRSTTEIKGALADASFGIVCVTRENARAPWLNFEAGALSKEVADSRIYVAPFLLDMRPEEISGPLSDFQVTRFTETDVRRMLVLINSQLGSQLTDSRFDTTFKMWWPELERQLKDVLEETEDDSEAPLPTTESMLAEILSTVRSQRKRSGQADVQPATIRTLVQPHSVDGGPERRAYLTQEVMRLIGPYGFEEVAWLLPDVVEVVSKNRLPNAVADAIKDLARANGVDVLFSNTDYRRASDGTHE